MFELRISSEGNHTSIPLVNATRWRIGRAEHCEIRVADQRVSAEHAELTHSGETLTLRRTGGQNPVESNGRRADEIVLASGSSFVIGHTHFAVITVRNGMNLLDPHAVLASKWGETEGLAAEIAAAPGRSSLPLSPVFLLSQLVSLMTQVRDKQSLAQRVLDLACQRLDATRGVLARVKDSEHLEIIMSKGMPAEGDAKALIATTILKQIIEEKQAVFIGNTSKDEQSASILRNQIQAIACTPIFNRSGQLVALLYVDNQQRPAEFQTQDAELLIWLGQIYNLMDENIEMQRRLEAELTALKHSASASVQMVAESPQTLLLLERVKKAAASEAAILILGESGSGKECIASLLHRQSARASHKFVARNCAAIPENLFESEMFGHKKGAFTGADSDRKGAFLEADGGTLFLDEIGDLSYPLQSKLLRVLQENVVRPVGSDKDIPVNVRVICATNKDLRECCKSREFREDLFYRISTLTLNVPPLRERKEDILALARHFVHSLGSGTRTLSKAAEQRLVTYPWPGNVRELRSILEQAIIFAGAEEIAPEELSLPVETEQIALEPQSLLEVERRHILHVMSQVDGNKSEASKLLGIARSTLILKLRTFQNEKVIEAKT